LKKRISILNLLFSQNTDDAEYRLRPLHELLSLLIAEVEHAALPVPRRRAGLQKRVGESSRLSIEWAGLATPYELCTVHDAEIL